MLINFVLLFLVFGAEKKKKNPYMAALLLGGIKAAIYALFSRSILIAAVMGLIYAGLAAAFVYFLKRIDRREAAERPEVPTYGSPGAATIRFQWEYIPLVILLILIVGGEILLA